MPNLSAETATLSKRSQLAKREQLRQRFVLALVFPVEEFLVLPVNALRFVCETRGRAKGSVNGP